MSSTGPDMTEVFLQEASEHLQFLREYSSILQDTYPAASDVERLYVAAHTLVGASGLYGYPRMSEVAGKLSHIFLYVMNAGISADAAAPLVEFIYEAVATLESDLLMISANGVEADEEIAAFKAKYPFAFQAEAQPEPDEADSAPSPMENLRSVPVDSPISETDQAEVTTAETPDLVNSIADRDTVNRL